jgi:pSer/pThr/pTyr-binding forkhead associated (FHA) protein
MNKLQLFVENQNKNYPLKPGREYVLGSGSECTPSLPYNNVADRHLKFSFDPNNNTWYLTDLNSNYGTFINDRQITDSPYPIDRETRISIGNSVVITVTPEEIIHNTTAPPPIAPIPIQVAPEYANPYPNVSSLNSPKLPVSIDLERVEIQELTWNQYVTKQVNKQQNLLAKIATNFYLNSGLRHTPWIRLNGVSDLGFGFDGYVIPNFLEKGSVQEVGRSIVNNISQLKGYQNTDCFITELADEHLINSAQESILQQLFSVRFFPIRRGGNGDFDYRKFLVISYHQIRTYLIVESYGSDLFVSWITRYEPNLASGIVYWLVTVAVLFLMLISSKSFVIATIPLCLWAIVYLLLPQVMKMLKILPKRANAYFFLFIFITQYLGALGYGLSKIQQNSSDDWIVSLGTSIGTLVIVALSFAIGTTITFLYVGAIAAAIWALEKASANTNNNIRR